MRRPSAPVVVITVGLLAGLVLLVLLQSPRRPGKPAAAPEMGLALFEWLSESRRGAEAVHPFQDDRGGWHIRIDLTARRYAALTPELEAEIKRRGARLESREEERRDGGLRFLWTIRGPDGGRDAKAILLFICPLATSPPPPPVAGRKPAAAVIIDDAGFNLALVRELAALGRPLTIAILPDAPLAAETAALAARSGLEIMLHLPLEAAGVAAGAPIDTIRSGMDAETIRAKMESFLRRVPGARGVNNHTGSRATEDAAVMLSILEVVKAHGLYFVDSRTTRGSVAYTAARALAVPAAERRVFLDQPPGKATVKARLRELFAAAKKQGTAIGIGHAKRETVAALREFLALADAEGVELVFASAVVR